MGKKRKKDSKKDSQQESRLLSPLKKFLRFAFEGIVIAIISAVCLSPLVRYFPGPKITAKITQCPLTSGNSAGSRLFFMQMYADEPIEYIEGELIFPARVDSSWVGVPIRTVTSNGKKVYAQMCEVGKDNDGKFKIPQQAVDTSINTYFKFSDRTLIFNASKIPARKPILGFIVIPDHEAIDKPSIIESTGSYDYYKYGIPIRRPFLVHNEGIDPGIFSGIQESSQTFKFDASNLGHIGLIVTK